MRRLRRLLRRQGGYSLIELISVMLILGTILGGITTAFVEGSNSELDMNNRFQAQENAALGLNKLRRDVHCASVITPSGTSSSITLTQPTGCSGGGGQISWCTVGSGTRYGLYRKTGSTCDATGSLIADYLTTGPIFTFTAQVASTSLAKLHVDMLVNIRPSKSEETYELADDIILRNSSRS